MNHYDTISLEQQFRISDTVYSNFRDFHIAYGRLADI